MANIKITDLVTLTDPVSTDVLPIVDVSLDVTKKISIAELLRTAGQGSQTAPGISFDGDTDTGVYSPGANQVAISTNGTGRLFVDADGRVRAITTGLGINGTSQNGFDLDVNGLSIFRGSLYFDNHSGISGDTTLSAPEGQSLVFKRGNNESARIDSSGRLGLGTSSPSYTLDVAGSTSMARLGKLQILNDAPFVTGVNIDSGANTIAFGTSGNAPVIFFANNIERLRIDSSGNVGIGTTSPGTKLCVYEAGGASQLRVGNSDIFAWDISRDNAASGALTFKNSLGSGFLEQMRIDAQGKLLVGTSTSRVVGGATERGVQIESTTSGPLGLSIVRNSNDSSGNTLVFGKSRGTALGSNTVVSNGDTLGSISFTGADGSDLGSFAAWIQCYVDGTPGSEDMPGRLVFATTADGASSPTERMRITSDGKVGIGTTAPDGLLDLAVPFSSGDSTSAGGVSTATNSFRRFEWGHRVTGEASEALNGRCGISFTLNPGTGGSNSEIGFITNQYGISRAERMRITSDGKVGIGTTAPQSIFVVRGSTPRITLEPTDDTQNTRIQFALADGTVKSRITGGGSDGDAIRFSQGSSERMRVDSGGNIGIGTTVPRAKLHVYGSGQNTANITDAGDRGGFFRVSSTGTVAGAGGGILFSSLQGDGANSLGFAAIKGLLTNDSGNTTGDLAFSVRRSTTDTALSEAMRIDSSGRLLVGTSSGFTFTTFSSTGTSRQQLVGIGTDDTASFAITHCNQGGNTRGPSLILAKNRSPNTTLGTVTNNENLGEVSFQGSASSAFVRGASILCFQDGGTPSSTSMAGRLVFSTTADGAASPTERMRINNLGAVSITKQGELAAETSALYVHTTAEFSQSALSPQYGIRVKQLGGRYDLQYGIYSEVADDAGFFGGENHDHFNNLRGVGVYGYSPCSNEAYQQAIGVYGKADNSNQNYNRIYGVAGRANIGTDSFGAVSSDLQAGYGGHFISHGKGNSVGVYADAYLEASPGAGTHATPLMVATNGSEIMRVTSDKYLRMMSGTGGIQFNGDTAEANALDDYEEGTWTPTATPSTSGTITLGSITASYTKIGNTVSIRADATVSAVSSPLGYIDISLPFTNSGNAAGSAFFYNGDTGAEMSDFIGRVSGNVFRIMFGTGQVGANSAPYARVNTEITIAAVYRN